MSAPDEMDRRFASVPDACVALERWRAGRRDVRDFAALLDLRAGRVRARVAARKVWISRLVGRGAADAIARLRERDERDLLVLMFDDNDDSGAMPLDELRASVALMTTEGARG